MATATKPDLVHSARLFHALSDPTRLRLLRSLRRGERCVCELMDATDAGQSRVSFHLKVLREAGLLLDRRDGRWVHYRINPDALTDIEETAKSLAPTGEQGPECAC
jgi:ArsR family transcriptional regulator